MGTKAYDLYDLEDKYRDSLEICKNFLISKDRVAKGSNINKARLDFIILKNPNCPLCGAIFNGKNSNTEHILPLGLGGENIINNKIQLCVACNASKNNVLQSYLGHPPYWKYYENKWNTIKKFILWSEIVSDEGIGSSNSVPSMHQRFLDARFGGIENNVDVRGYGRLSSWKVGDEPNIICIQSNTKNIDKKQTQNGSKNIILTMFENGLSKLGDKLFIDDTRTIKPLMRGARNKSHYQNKHEVNKESPEPLDVVIKKLIGNETISLQKLGHNISEYQEIKSGTRGTKAFFAEYGCKGTMKNILVKELGEIIDISGKHPNHQIKISKSTDLENIDLEPLEEVIKLLIGKEMISLQKLGNKISKYEYERSGLRGTKAFFATYGYKGTMKNILENELVNIIEINGEHPNHQINIKI